jgi:hypothetical protein
LYLNTITYRVTSRIPIKKLIKKIIKYWCYNNGFSAFLAQNKKANILNC